MTDESLRRSQRERELDPEGEVRWLSERLRSGALDQERLELAAYLAHPGALVLTPQDSPPDDEQAFAEWVAGLSRWGPACAVRAGLALLGGIPLPGYGSDRFNGPNDHVLGAHESLARWAQTPERMNLATLHTVQEQLQEAGGYGIHGAVSCAFSLLRIPAEPELAASHLRDACARALSRLNLHALLRALQEELWPWALGEADPLDRVLAQRGERWLRLSGLSRGLVWGDPERVWTASSTGEVVAYGLDGEPQLELAVRQRDIYAFAGGPRGQLAVGEDSGACEVWQDPEQPGLPFLLESSPHAFAFSPDGGRLWAGTHAGRVVGVDLAQGVAQVGIDVTQRAVTSLCVVDDELWAGAREGWIVGLTSSGRELRRIGPLEYDVVALTALPDGRLVAACRGELIAYDLERGVELSRVEAHTSAAYDLVRVPGTNQVVSVGGDRDRCLAWTDVDSAAVLRRWETPSVLLKCAVSPDGRYALSGARTGLVRRHELVL